MDGRLFEKIMEIHPECASDEVWFVDLGAGLGKAMMLAAGYPWARLVGVELDENLIWGLKRNLAKFAARVGKMPDWDVVATDARTYRFPERPLMVFLFNPFCGEVLAEVIANLVQRIETSTEPVWVLYVNPVEAAFPEMWFESVDGRCGGPFSGQVGWQLYRGHRGASHSPALDNRP
ncbi:MAG: class I SAM-dependent methyltransferase [Magnetococcales bacterium]|nr:class I SAM-dependent methyltransferase [Magnetococcales bacterium]